MSNLLAFLVRYNAFFLFLLFEGLAFYIIVKTADDAQYLTWLASSNRVTGFFTERFDNIVNYWNLPAENDQLKVENARLKAQLRQSQYADVKKIDSIAVIDTAYEQRYTYIPAGVISNSVVYQNNYLTLDKGSRHGIKPHTAVISPDGIVGIVQSCSERFSSVISLFHPSTRISAAIKRNNYFGSLVWKGNDPRHMLLETIPNHAKIVKHDTVITTGYSALFPANLIIGTVDTFWQESGSNFYSVRVRLSNDMGNIRTVYIVNDLMKPEINSLLQTEANDK